MSKIRIVIYGEGGPYEEFTYDPDEGDAVDGDWTSNAGQRHTMWEVFNRELPQVIEELMGL